MTKEQLRQKYLNERQNLTQKEVAARSLKIFEQFCPNFSLKPLQKVHIFLPIEKFREIDTWPFINCFWQNGQQVFVPKVVGNQMISLKITPETPFILSPWGISEPAGEITQANDFDFVLTPLVYADGRGHRVGYGKGFYDRFFGSLSRPAIKIGLSLFPPNEIITDAGEHDVRLDYLLTPDAALSFNAGG